MILREMLKKLNEINKSNICDRCEEIVESRNYETIHDDCNNSLDYFFVLNDDKNYDNPILDPRVFENWEGSEEESVKSLSMEEKFRCLFEYHQQCVKNLNSFFPEPDTSNANSGYIYKFGNDATYSQRGEGRHIMQAYEPDDYKVANLIMVLTSKERISFTTCQ